MISRTVAMKTTANVTVVQLSEDREVCLSYGVPVAAFVPGYGYVKTSARYSVTTSKHATAYAGRDAKVLDDTAFRALAPELVGVSTKGGR
jgi:hypothetical protein